MNATKTNEQTGEATYLPAAYATSLNKGLERLFEVSKTSLELAVEHNAAVLVSYKKALTTPGFFLFGLANRVLEDYVMLLKGLLDLAIVHPVIEADQKDSHDTSKAKAEITDQILQSVDRMIAAQKSTLSLTAKKTKAVNEQACVNRALAETFEDIVQLRVEALLAKEIVDLVVKQQPCVDGASDETVADIVQLRVNTLRATESADRIANPSKTAADPAVN
jgi:hypothetical protein